MWGASNRGGPGLYSIQPFGDGLLDERSVNWANATNFSTAQKVVKLDTGSSAFINSGDFTDLDTVTRIGTTTNWAEHPVAYIQLDLGAHRWIDLATVVWAREYSATSIRLLVSDDGETETFGDVEGFAMVNLTPGGVGGYCASELRFDPVYTRYIRLVDAKKSGANLFLKQLLVMGCKDPTQRGTVIIVR